MLSDFAIRPLGPQHRPEWEVLWDGYNAFYGRVGATALPRHNLQTTWNRLISNQEPVHGLAALSGNRLIGFAHVIFHRNTLHIEDTCYLQDLFTAPEHRGQGVARQLIEAVYALCKSRGVSSVYWHTHASNAAARALYDKVADNTGFVVYRASV